MSEASSESKPERRSCIGKTTYLSLSRVRRASKKDLPSLLKFVNNQTRQLFGEVNYKKILYTCFIPTCVENDRNEPIGFIFLDDYPNVPYIPSSDWCCWLSNIYGLQITTPKNTAWIHLIVYNDEYSSEFFQPILRSIFEEYCFLEYVILVIPPRVSSIAFIEGYGTRIVPPGFYDSKKVQTLYLLVRQHFVTNYKIRRAVEEDNDDLVPLVYEHSHRLTETYGEFYVAEIIMRHPDSGRQLIVAEYDDMAVSVLFLNSSVNNSLLNDEFELVPFHGLRKPHPNDEVHDFYRLSSVADLMENREDDALSKLHTKTRPLDTSPSYLESILSEHEEESTQSEYPEDDILLVNVSSVHLLINEHSDFLSITSSESQTYSAMILSCSNDQDIRLYDLDLEPNLKNLSGADYAQNYPSFLGELNAFTLEVAASQVWHELESTLLLLAAAFECFPEKEYCVMSIPSTCPPFPMLDHFVRVAPRPTSTYPHELYILHRNTIMSELSVRPAVISDVEEVQRLIENISVIQGLIDDFLSAVCDEYDFTSYVMISEDKIVGVSVVKDETNFDYLKAHYILTEMLEEEHYKSASYGLLLHLVLSPIFLRHGKYFYKEIMRLGDYTALNYYVALSDTVTLTRDKSICNTLGDMIPVKPRKMAEYTQSNLGECMPEHPVIKLSDPFALYVITGQYCSLKQYDINAKIVVVGSSDTALAFLNSLINGESASYRVNFTNITVVSPHGLNYQKKDHKVRKKLFVSKSNYNYRLMNQIAMRTYVNIINGVMTKINRIDKQLIVNKDSYVPYDLLFLMGGQQFQKPQLKSSKQFPENVFLINTEIDATHALKQLKLWTDPLPDSKYTVIVYGYALEAFCCVGALLEFGVPPANITFIESYPLLSEHVAMQFADPEVNKAVINMITSEGVVHHKSYYFVEWILDTEINLITDATFASGHRRLFIECKAMFMYNEKTVSARTSSAITNSGLVFDGGLVIDANCQTIDPFIYGAGTLTKYSRRYYADHLAHKYFNQEEIGSKLGHSIRQKLIPNYDECPPEELLHCVKGDMMVPHYKQPLITFCHLPGNLQYLSVTKPGKQVPLSAASADDDYGHVLVTGDCNNIENQGYFRLHLNQFGTIETVTCLAKFEFDRQNITSLWGKHEKLLNNVKTRFEMTLIGDLFNYFKEPWTCAIYHDRFANFQDSIMDILNSVTSVKGLSPIEDIIRLYKMNSGEKLNIQQEEELNQKFMQSCYHKTIQKRLLEFVQQNRMFLPMYAHPHVVSRFETDCEKSPLFRRQ
ncbi:hypothetical protein FQR65_LT14767 [Abscondita terminalis]|nr:hypothetical protein FQR65_LT14767 [Abscondita terminalis]